MQSSARKFIFTLALNRDSIRWIHCMPKQLHRPCNPIKRMNVLVYNKDSRMEGGAALLRTSASKNQPALQGTAATPVSTARETAQRQTVYVYDGYGHLASIGGPGPEDRFRRFQTDVDGHILLKEESGRQNHALIVNGQMLGMSGADGEHTFTGPAASLHGSGVDHAPATYTVQDDSETLRDIARKFWGDASLWSLIADANGMEAVHKRDVIVIPARSTVLHNDASTFRPYSPAEMTGDVMPVLPAPAGEQGCGRIGQVIELAVSIIATNLFGAIPGNLASQVVAMAMGDQDDFSWESLARSALTAGVSLGMDAYLGPISESLEGIDRAMDLAGRAAASSVIAQGAAMATGLQDRFQWRDVAASALSQGIGDSIRHALNAPDVLDRIGPLGASLASAFGDRLTGALLRGGRVNLPGLLLDSFGNALGNAWSSAPSGVQAVSQQAFLLDGLEENTAAGMAVPWNFNAADGYSSEDEWKARVAQALTMGGTGLPDDATDAEWMAQTMSAAGFGEEWVMTDTGLRRKAPRRSFSDARFEYGKLAYAATRTLTAEQVWQQKLDAVRGLQEEMVNAASGFTSDASRDMKEWSARFGQWLSGDSAPPAPRPLPAPQKAAVTTRQFNLVRELDTVASLQEASNFKTAMQFSMRWEGGYVNDPSDRGGETKFGISKRAYPSEDIRNLTLERAVDLYRQDYWNALQLDSLESKPAVVMMDIAINHGTGRARKWGAATTDPDALLDKRVQFYRAIVERDPSQQKFLNGWLKRTDSLRTYIKDK
jgi:hypothetical protein